MGQYKDLYLIIGVKNDIEKSKNTFINELYIEIKNKYGIIELSKLFYISIKECYNKLSILIVWIQRHSQKIIQQCIKNMNNYEILGESGILRKLKAKIIKIKKYS